MDHDILKFSQLFPRKIFSNSKKFTLYDIITKNRIRVHSALLFWALVPSQIIHKFKKMYIFFFHFFFLKKKIKVNENMLEEEHGTDYDVRYYRVMSLPGEKSLAMLVRLTPDEI